MSDEKKQPDLTWLPKLSVDEWQTELDFLCSMRVSLAGLALRHVADPDGGRVNEGLNNDIAAVQAQLQHAIDRVRECASSLRDLAKLVKDEQPATETPETLH